jgi:hypothetical protein
VLFIRDKFDDAIEGKPKRYGPGELERLINAAGLVYFNLKVLLGEFEVEMMSEYVVRARYPGCERS